MSVTVRRALAADADTVVSLIDALAGYEKLDRPSAERRAGVGQAIIRFLAQEAVARGCGRMEWAVLDWNQSAIDFYEKLGARRLADWQVYRLTRDQLEAITAVSA